jgi:hypothetical protein
MMAKPTTRPAIEGTSTEPGQLTRPAGRPGDHGDRVAGMGRDGLRRGRARGRAAAPPRRRERYPRRNSPPLARERVHPRDGRRTERQCAGAVVSVRSPELARLLRRKSPPCRGAPAPGCEQPAQLPSARRWSLPACSPRTLGVSSSAGLDLAARLVAACVLCEMTGRAARRACHRWRAVTERRPIGPARRHKKVHTPVTARRRRDENRR